MFEAGGTNDAFVSLQTGKKKGLGMECGNERTVTTLLVLTF